MPSPFSASAILDMWERGSSVLPFERATLLLASAITEHRRVDEEERGFDVEALEDLTIGERDFELAQVRRAAFGDRLVCVADCSQCGERLEFELSIRELWAERPVRFDENAWIERGDHRVRIREITCRDMSEASRCPSVQAAAALLTERAIVSAKVADRDVSVHELPRSVVEEVGRDLERRAPDLDTRLELTCVACGHGFRVGLDIAAHLWSDIVAEAQRLLREVAALARAYGWSEADVLAMSPARRHAYLTLGGVA